MHMMLLNDYVVIDLEMTGLNAKIDKILELGAVKVRDGKPVEFFSKIVNPRVTLSEKVTELTGITQQMADDGADLDETVSDFFEFLGEDLLVGQNIIFDYGFLKQWAVNHKIPLEKNAVDTLKLARKFLPAEQKKDLESLCTYFEIQRQNAHRALDDAVETAEIFEKLKDFYYEKEPDAFLPKALQYKAKKQSPATLPQKRYLKQFTAYHGIDMPQDVESMSKSEMSRLTDKLIAQYGKIPKQPEA